MENLLVIKCLQMSRCSIIKLHCIVCIVALFSIKHFPELLVLVFTCACFQLLCFFSITCAGCQLLVLVFNYSCWFSITGFQLLVLVFNYLCWFSITCAGFQLLVPVFNVAFIIKTIKMRYQ